MNGRDAADTVDASSGTALVLVCLDGVLQLGEEQGPVGDAIDGHGEAESFVTAQAVPAYSHQLTPGNARGVRQVKAPIVNDALDCAAPFGTVKIDRSIERELAAGGNTLSARRVH